MPARATHKDPFLGYLVRSILVAWFIIVQAGLTYATQADVGGSAVEWRNEPQPIIARPSERARSSAPPHISAPVPTIKDRLGINPDSGASYRRIIFASGTAARSSGTPDDPTSLEDALFRAGDNGIVVAEGTINTRGITLPAGAMLVGGGTEIQVLRDAATTLVKLGTTPAVILGNGQGAVIRLKDGSQLRNLTVEGGKTGIEATALAGDISLHGVSILNIGGDGLALIGNTGSIYVEDLVVSGSAGHGIRAGNSSLSIQRASISDTAGDGINVVNSSGTTFLSLNRVAVSSAAGGGISVDGSAGGTTIVTSFVGNSVSQAGAGGVVFETVTFDADAVAAGLQWVSGGDLQVGSNQSVGVVEGDGLRLNNVRGNISFENLTIDNSGGTGLYLRGVLVEASIAERQAEMPLVVAQRRSVPSLRSAPPRRIVPPTATPQTSAGPALRTPSRSGVPSAVDGCGKIRCPDAASLSVKGGKVKTGGGTPIDLDPVTVDITLSSVEGSGGTHGLLLDEIGGTFTVTGPVTVSNMHEAAILIRDSAGVFSFGELAVAPPESASIEMERVSGRVLLGGVAIFDDGE